MTHAPNPTRSATMDRLLRAVREAARADDPSPQPGASGERAHAPLGEDDGAEAGEDGATSGFYVVGPRAETRVLVLAADAEAARSVRKMLRRALPTRASFSVAGTLDEVARDLRARPYDVLVAHLDGAAPSSALAVLAAAAAHHGDVPLVVLGDSADPAVAAEACARGAQEYLELATLTDVLLARAVSCARARAERTRRLLEVAQVDDLTGVANRRPLHARFVERRRAALRDGEGIAMLIVDVDRFKEVNDLHGHLAGDRVLSAVASRIVAEVRAPDLVARLGGDEVAVLLDSIDEDALAELARRLEGALSRPVTFGEAEIPVAASVGYALGGADEIADLGVLARRADDVMYQRKRARLR